MLFRCSLGSFLVVSALGLVGCGSDEPEVLPAIDPEVEKAQLEAYEKEMMEQMKKNRRPVPPSK